jgi:outer membrane lipoprotein SlyB
MNCKRTGFLLLPVLLAACATARPVIYPTATAELRGAPAQELAVQECLQRANAADLDNPGAEVAATTARDTAIGAAGGAAAGAVYGNAGRGAGAGAAAGAATGLIRGLFRSQQPSAVYQTYVSRCMSERGYEVIGWR